MGDIWNYAIALIVIAFMRWLLPKFGKLVNWIINKLVKLMEKLIKGSKLGETKKKWVLRVLRLLGIKATEGVSTLIDIAVDAMNNKKEQYTTTVKDEVQMKVVDKVDDIVNK